MDLRISFGLSLTPAHCPESCTMQHKDNIYPAHCPQPCTPQHNDNISTYTTSVTQKNTSSNKRTSHIQNLHFDSNSVPLLVDNGTSASITTQAADFIDYPTPVNSQVNGISRNTAATLKGTVQWHIEDDQGIINSHSQTPIWFWEQPLEFYQHSI